MKEKIWLQKMRFGKLLCLIIMASILLIPAKIAKAENYTFTLNDTWVNGYCAKQTTNFYEFELPSAGWVDITFQGWSINFSMASLMNGDMTKTYKYEGLSHTSATDPKTKNLQAWLEAGKYVVSVRPNEANSYGDYRLKGSFTPANNTEREPNNTFLAAMPLTSGDAGKVLGLLSEDDRVDFYSIYIPTTQKVQITFTSMVSDFSKMEVWDKNFELKYSGTNHWCSETAPKTYTCEETLTPGTWYLKVEPAEINKRDKGRYYLSWKPKPETVPVSAISISGGRDMTVGEQINLHASVLPSNATNSAVQWSSDNTSVATVDSNGRVTANNAGTAYIKATAADGSGVAATCKITVKIKVASIKISGNKRVAAGTSFNLKVSVSPSDADNKTVSWSSSNKTVAAVSSSGKVTAKKPGKTVITAKAKDGSGKKASVTVIVVPQKVTISSLASTTKNQIKLLWKKQSNISGYQIQVSKYDSFKNAKEYFVDKNAGGIKIKKLTSKKTYYIRVRSYIKIDSKKYYSSWSAVKSIKVK